MNIQCDKCHKQENIADAWAGVALELITGWLIDFDNRLVLCPKCKANENTL